SVASVIAVHGGPPRWPTTVAEDQVLSSKPKSSQPPVCFSETRHVASVTRAEPPVAGASKTGRTSSPAARALLPAPAPTTGRPPPRGRPGWRKYSVTSLKTGVCQRSLETTSLPLMNTVIWSSQVAYSLAPVMPLTATSLRKKTVCPGLASLPSQIQLGGVLAG